MASPEGSSAAGRGEGGGVRHQLYAMEFANGLIKVGVSYRPHMRRLELQRKYKTRITRMHAVHHVQDRCSYVAERALINRMRRMSVSVASEIFAFVSFGAAANLVTQIARREYPMSHEMSKARKRTL
jgi:hypothetical protein